MDDALETRVEDVPQGVAQEVERQDQDKNGKPRHHGQEWVLIEHRIRLLEHVAPRGRGWLDADADEAERRLDQNRVAH